MVRQRLQRDWITRDRLILLLGLVVMTLLAWAYTIHLAAAAHGMSMPRVMAWGPGDFLMMFIMWAVMMVAMMLPSATPMILGYSTIQHRRTSAANPRLAVAAFTLSYIVVWTGFSLAATLANWGLHQTGLMTSKMGSAATLLAGILLIVAGLYQWTPLKSTCLKKCRSPVMFLLTNWHDGIRGAWWMGLQHGTYCVLCCWALMTLLFVLGVMNLAWIAVLTGIALLEKLMPWGMTVARGLGVVLIGWGAWLVTGLP